MGFLGHAFLHSTTLNTLSSRAYSSLRGKNMSSNNDDLEVVRTYLANLSDLKIESLIAALHPDIVMIAPFAPEPLYPRKIDGKEAATAIFHSIPQIIAPPNFFDINIDPLQRPGEFICTLASDTKAIPTNLPYKNRYLFRITVRDGLIAGFTEYFDPIVLVKALGGTVKLPGV